MALGDVRSPAHARSTVRGWHRRWPRAVGIVVALVVLAWTLGWLIGSRVAARVLRAEVEQRFDARVELGSVSFLPPWWLVARDLRLTGDVDGTAVEWVTVDAVEVTLGWMPLRDGRPQVELLEVLAPTVVVVQTGDGVRDVLDLWRGGALETSGGLPRRTLIEGARITARDLASDDHALPAIGGVRLILDRAAPDASRYGITVDGGDQRLAIDAHGVLDPDARSLSLRDLDVRFHLDAPVEGDERTTPPDVRLSGVQVTLALDARRLTVEQGTMTFPGEPPLVIDGLRGSLTLGDGRLDADDVAASVAGGKVDGSLALVWKDAPTWKLNGNASDVDVAVLAQRLPQLGGTSVRGILSGNGSFEGRVTADRGALLDSLAGSGEGRIRNGQFYRVPLVAKLLEQAKLGAEGATLSDAAARVRVAKQTITLDQAVMGSPTIGVQGTGTMGFDGGIDLEMVVVPLGDWRARLHTGSVPVIGEALGSLVGKVQSLVGEASALAYQFHVTGTVQDPRLVPVPVPALTKRAAAVFGRMARDGFSSDVLADE